MVFNGRRSVIYSNEVGPGKFKEGGTVFLGDNSKMVANKLYSQSKGEIKEIGYAL
jgi:hypothetical protein